MSWYGIDAVGKSFTRTNKTLFEPFEFRKWAILAIIILLGGMSSSWSPNIPTQMYTEDFGHDFQDIEVDHSSEMPFDSMGFDLDSIHYPEFTWLLVAGIVIILLILLFFLYVSNVMQFVFVEALVRNEVYFWAYSRRFLKKGFYLLLIRLALGLLFLIFLGIALLPFALKILHGSPQDLNWVALLGGFFWLMAVIMALSLIMSAIDSFLGLAIPVSIYQETGILSAFKKLLGNFRKSWKEVLVYWLVRFIQGIVIAILLAILLLLLVVGLGLIFLIFDGILYLIFSAVLSGSLPWLLLTPFVLVELLLFLIAVLLLNVPFSVYIKYHMLSFLGMWYVEAGIPFYDE
jgi:hypothetical protein